MKKQKIKFDKDGTPMIELDEKPNINIDISTQRVGYCQEWEIDPMTGKARVVRSYKLSDKELDEIEKEFDDFKNDKM